MNYLFIEAYYSIKGEPEPFKKRISVESELEISPVSEPCQIWPAPKLFKKKKPGMYKVPLT